MINFAEQVAQWPHDVVKGKFRDPHNLNAGYACSPDCRRLQAEAHLARVRQLLAEVDALDITVGVFLIKLSALIGGQGKGVRK